MRVPAPVVCHWGGYRLIAAAAGGKALSFRLGNGDFLRVLHAAAAGIAVIFGPAIGGNPDTGFGFCGIFGFLGRGGRSRFRFCLGFIWSGFR